MTRRSKAAFAVAVGVGALGFGCAATFQSYDKISLGMNSEQVLSVAGKPNRVFRMESAGEGTMIPTPAGKSETWIYNKAMIQFHDGKVVAKGEKAQ